MSEKERLAEAAALFLERKRKAEELAALDRRIEIILYPEHRQKRKQPVRSDRELVREVLP